jgi:parallel beta-helix repeat protein
MNGKTFCSTMLVLAAYVIAAIAQAPDTLWTRTYGGSHDDYGQSVQQTTDGGYIITGWTDSYGAGSNDVYLVKTDFNGDTLWTRTYGGISGDNGYSVQQTNDGGYIIAGQYFYDPIAGFIDVYLIKTNTLGEIVWTRTFGGFVSDVAYCVQQTQDGGYIIAGYTASFGAGGSDFWLIKTDSLGDTSWTRTFGSEDCDEARSVQQTQDGGYIIAGYTNDSMGLFFDILLIKTDPSGNQLWSQTYGGEDYEKGYSVKQTMDGGYIVTGYTESFDIDSADVYLIKTNSTGDTLWTRTYGGSCDDGGYDVQQTTDGGYIVTGHTKSYGAGGLDVYLIKTDQSGNELWSQTFGASNIEQSYSVQQTADAGYIVAGCTNSYGAGGNDIYLIRLDADPGPNTPAAPQNFTVTNSQDTLRANLSWINPDSTVGGIPLTDLDGVMIFRNDSLITTLTGMLIGQSVDYIDSTMTGVGLYQYTVIAFNDFGYGFPARASSWIGLDTPGAPSNVIATPAPGGALACTLAWVAPTQSGHGGYWPGTWIGQIIFRDDIPQDTLMGTNITYVDTLPGAGWFSYGVGYFNASGTGPIAAATPDPVFVGMLLSGSYDIGGGQNDFNTIVEAVTAMNGVGIGGPTTFNVYPGTYDGQVTLYADSIPGVSATNYITFQGVQGATDELPVVINTTGSSSSDGCGFNLTAIDYVTIKSFEITNCSYSGIRLYYNDDDSSTNCTLEGNYIHDIGPTANRYGIYLRNTVECDIIGNEVDGDYYGIYGYYCRGNLYANNMVYGHDRYGIRVYKGSENKVFYNSVYTVPTASSSYTFYCRNSTNRIVKNNIFYNSGSGSDHCGYYVYGDLASYPLISDYNNIYAPNGTVGYYDGNSYATLAAFQAATGLDSNSISADPYFLSTSAPFDLHIDINTPSPVDSAGTPIVWVVDDFDGDLRDIATPDIGADEFFAGIPPVEDLVVQTVGDDIRLDWSPAAGATSYKIYSGQSPDFGDMTLLTTTSELYYVHQDIVSGNSKTFYAVTATNE